MDEERAMRARDTVLITGAAGFVGQALAHALSATGWRVLGLDRAPCPESGAGAFKAFLQHDLGDEAACPRFELQDEIDAIVHLAAVLPARAARRELFEINAQGTARVLESYAQPGTHFVLFSTGLVYGPQSAPFREGMKCAPSGDYAESKLAAEVIAMSWGWNHRSPVAVLRPSVLYGTYAPQHMLLRSLVAALKKGEPFPMTGGEQLRDFLHVDDAVRGAARVLEQRAHGVWNLASNESASVLEAATLAARIARRPDLLRIGALPYRDDEVFDYRLDATKLRMAFDWQPRVDLATGIGRLWEAAP
jgi:nucleoside-diphosphate-sugar epimerase